MAGKKKETILQITVSSQEQWDEMLAVTGLTVVDVYQGWCGPCKAVISLFRKIKNELGDDLLHFAMAEVDNVDSLQEYRGKCEPTFLFYGGGQLVAVVRGANTPLLQKTILEHLVAEKKVLEEGADRKVVQEAGFEIICQEERTLTEDEARGLYQHQSEESHFEELIRFMSSGPCRALVISEPEGTDEVIPLWKEFIGPTDVEIAKQEKPESLRALYGTEKLFNAVHGCDDKEQAARELAFFFPSFGAGSEAHNDAETGQRVEKTLALIRPDILKDKKESILQKINEAGLTIAMQKEILLTEQQVYEFYREHTEAEYFPALLQNMTSGPVLALALASNDAVSHWRNQLGPQDVRQAKEEAPESLRARFAVESIPINQLHGSNTPEEAERELKFFFQVEHTLAVIKPDAMENHKDMIVQKIEEGGFIISQMEEKVFSRELAEEFYKEHKGKPFFDKLIDYMTEGPSLTMILSKENAVEEWRNLMGPRDPEEAKKVAPDSLRAKFAKDVLRNSLHGPTDRMQAIEKIKFLFGDINIGVDGIVQGIEPNLEKIVYPEYREESEDTQLRADAVDSTEKTEVGDETPVDTQIENSKSTFDENLQKNLPEEAPEGQVNEEAPDDAYAEHLKTSSPDGPTEEEKENAEGNSSISDSI
ncbi:thioredoxin domain-containing protein 6-like isoform X3 [Mobula birostris]|uniref:thioredoxin domain-containing protein 6-like isoform X3 n=1 Tax=Mobula birostris TaxID=1983395 RepID=UPI003B27ED98